MQQSDQNEVVVPKKRQRRYFGAAPDEQNATVITSQVKEHQDLAQAQTNRATTAIDDFMGLLEDGRTTDLLELGQNCLSAVKMHGSHLVTSSLSSLRGTQVIPDFATAALLHSELLARGETGSSKLLQACVGTAVTSYVNSRSNQQPGSSQSVPPTIPPISFESSPSSSTTPAFFGIPMGVSTDSPSVEEISVCQSPAPVNPSSLSSADTPTACLAPADASRPSSQSDSAPLFGTLFGSPSLGSLASFLPPPPTSSDGSPVPPVAFASSMTDQKFLPSLEDTIATFQLDPKHLLPDKSYVVGGFDGFVEFDLRAHFEQSPRTRSMNKPAFGILTKLYSSYFKMCMAEPSEILRFTWTGSSRAATRRPLPEKLRLQLITFGMDLLGFSSTDHLPTRVADKLLIEVHNSASNGLRRAKDGRYVNGVFVQRIRKVKPEEKQEGGGASEEDKPSPFLFPFYDCQAAPVTELKQKDYSADGDVIREVFSDCESEL